MVWCEIRQGSVAEVGRRIWCSTSPCSRGVVSNCRRVRPVITGRILDRQSFAGQRFRSTDGWETNARCRFADLPLKGLSVRPVRNIRLNCERWWPRRQRLERLLSMSELSARDDHKHSCNSNEHRYTDQTHRLSNYRPLVIFQPSSRRTSASRLTTNTPMIGVY